MLGMKSGVLLGNVASCCSLLCLMFRTGSTGTEVKRAFMSYDDMVSPCDIVIDLAAYELLGVSDMVGGANYQRL